MKVKFLIDKDGFSAGDVLDISPDMPQYLYWMKKGCIAVVGTTADAAEAPAVPVGTTGTADEKPVEAPAVPVVGTTGKPKTKSKSKSKKKQEVKQ